MNEKLQSHFLNLYAMALSDTQIETIELEVLYKIGQERGVDKNQIDDIILHPDKIKFSFPDTLNEKITYLYDLAKIILADGIVDSNERKTLELFCTKFGFESSNVSAIAEFLISSAKERIDISDLLQVINYHVK